MTESHLLWFVVFAGCGSHAKPDADPSGFLFRVIDELPPNIDEVTADGVPQMLQPDGSTMQLVFEQSYESYAVAQQSDPISLELLANGTVQYRGQALPGECARDCTSVPPCPLTDELTIERITVPQNSDFAVFQYTCLECIGGTHDGYSCH